MFCLIRMYKSNNTFTIISLKVKTIILDVLVQMISSSKDKCLCIVLKFFWLETYKKILIHNMSAQLAMISCIPFQIK